MNVQTPDRKVNVGLAAGAVMTVLAWISKQFGGVEIPAEVALAGSTLVIFIIQYMVPNALVEDDPLSNQAGFVRLLMLAVLLTISAGLVASFSGCATPPTKVLQVACQPSSTYRVERCAKSIGETWEIYQVRVEELITDSATPADVKDALKKAEAATRPVILGLLKADAVYAQIHIDLAAGKTQDEQLAIANAKLEEWIQLALPQITALGDSLGM